MPIFDPSAKHLLFLSHAGIDTDEALDLAVRLEATKEAQTAGLRVWVDKRDLLAGRSWQSQLEDVLQHGSTAFAVFVGARGVINWVESEVRVALSRANGSDSYPIIPILIGDARPEDLPVFVRQYHAVRAATSSDPDLLRRLIEANLSRGGRVELDLVEHPFVGLTSFSEATANLFYGRDREVDELVERLRRTNLVMVVGDSGSGKSSVARAGLVPRFRGGAFASSKGDRPDPTAWQVVEMRPQAQPFERLVDAVNKAAQQAGISAQDRGALADWVRTRRPEKIRDALRDCAPAPAKTLLLVDQFEELWTLTSEEDRKEFVQALMDVADGAGSSCRIVLTMRYDYYGLCQAFPLLWQRLEMRDAPSRYLLRRMNNSSLREAILGPLRLTTYREDPATKTFADAVLEDIGDRPGDLALVEMALAETWRYRGEYGNRLLDAYSARGGVAGALANAAEEVFHKRLSKEAPDVIKGFFIRLVRLGDTGGTTRRIVRRWELTDQTWILAQRLAGGSSEGEDERYARLVAVSGEPGKETIEITHEALVTQWPRYQAWLEDAASDKRVFDRMIEAASAWSTHDEDSEYLARGADLEAITKLQQDRASWLSSLEARFADASASALRALKVKEKSQRLGLLALVGSLVIATLFSILALLQSKAQTEIANAQREEAQRQAAKATEQQELAESRALAAEAINLWHPLIAAGDQRLALVALANSRPTVRKRFVEEIFHQWLFAERFASDDSIVRALVGISISRRNLLIETLLKVELDGNVDPNVIAALARAAIVLGGSELFSTLTRLCSMTSDPDALRLVGLAFAKPVVDVTGDEAAQAVARLSEAVTRTNDDDSKRALAQGIAALAPRLGRDQAAHAVASLTETLVVTADAAAQGTMALGIAALSPNAEQVAKAVAGLTQALGTTRASDAPEFVVRGIAALAPILTDDHAEHALASLLEALETMAADAFQASALAQGLAALAPRLTANQRSQAVIRLIRDLDKTSDPFKLSSLAEGIAALSPTPDMAEQAVGRLIKAIEEATFSFAIASLAQSIAALSPTLDEAAKAAARLIDSLGNPEDPWKINSQGVAALAPRLAAHQADQFVAQLISTLQRNANDAAVSVLARSIAALSPTPDQAAQAMARLMDSVERTAVGSEFVKAVRVIPEIAHKLPDEQREQAVGRLMKALLRVTGEAESLALAQAIMALSPGPDHVERAMTRLMELLQRTRSATSSEALIKGIAALAPRFTNEEVIAVLVFELARVPWVAVAPLQVGFAARLKLSTESKQSFLSFLSAGRERFGNLVDFEKPLSLPIIEDVKRAMTKNR